MDCATPNNSGLLELGKRSLPFTPYGHLAPGFLARAIFLPRTVDLTSLTWNLSGSSMKRKEIQGESNSIHDASGRVPLFRVRARASDD